MDKERLITNFYDRLFRRSRDDEWGYEEDLVKRKIDETNRTGKVPDLENRVEVRYYTKLLAQVKKMLGVQTFASMKIAEYGSGTGLLSLYMAQEGAHVTLVDFNPHCLEYSQLVLESMRKASQFKGSLSLVQGDFLKLDFHEGFDLIHSTGIVEHFDNLTALEMTEKMVNDVRINGQVLVGVPNFLSPDLIYLWATYGKGSEAFYSKSKMRNLLTNSGLEDVQVTTSTFFYPSFIPAPVTKVEPVENFLGEQTGLGFLIIGAGRKLRK